MCLRLSRELLANIVRSTGSRVRWTVPAVLGLLGPAFTGSVSAFDYVVDANGTYWGIQDAAPPRVDTGSIRATQVAPGGQSGAFSTSINGFGGIKVRVRAASAPRF